MTRDEKQRYISMQRQVTIARRALEKLSRGCNDQMGVADHALEQMLHVEMGKLHALEPIPWCPCPYRKRP